ncbi:NUDIX hydrolase [Anaerocolumna jejuensis]|uniref:NUDIX hydrolase n=1 Tax=Anaerocolumna jejuensis TaxID=259063 RepID=UPI003F7CA86F
MEYTHFVSAAALVINDENEILLLKSPDRGWEYPGGMVESGETFQETIIREVLEETGVEVEILSFAGVSINIERNIVNMDFICRYKKGDLKTSDESLALKWVKKEDAFEMVSNPLTKKRLKNMLSNSKDIYCFGFKKEPFSTVNDKYYSIGL